MSALVRAVPLFTAGNLSANVLSTRVLGTPELDAKSLGECIAAFMENTTELFAAHVNFIARTVSLVSLDGVAQLDITTSAMQANDVIPFATVPQFRGVNNTLAERVASYELVRDADIMRPTIALVDSVDAGVQMENETLFAQIGGVLLPTTPRYNLATLLNALERVRVSDENVAAFAEALIVQKAVVLNQNAMAGTTNTNLQAGSIYLFGGLASTLKPSVQWEMAAFNAGTIEVPAPEGNVAPDADPIAFE